jgi:Flp pilus assembly protein TadG
MIRLFGARSRDRSRRPEQAPERGQVLVLFAIFLTAILIALALLFDGAQSLVLRRQLQNSADAAALAGVNIVQATNGCSATLVAKSGSGNTIYQKVRASLMDNLGVTSARADALLTKSDGSNGVECGTDAAYSPYEVRVSLLGTNPTYFGNMAGIRDIGVGVTASAFNGPAVGGKYSITMLDPCHNGTAACNAQHPSDTTAWPTQRNGCPSIQFNGGPTVTFEGSLHSNSACLFDATWTGAVGTSGSGNASITLANTSSGPTS